MTKSRCAWAKETNQLYLDYHDNEWGVPTTDDKMLFEMLVLEGCQAGLSWETILNKREGYRAAFYNFDITQRLFMGLCRSHPHPKSLGDNG